MHIPHYFINCLEMFKGRRPYNPQLSPGRHFTALTGHIGHVRLTHTITTAYNNRGQLEFTQPGCVWTTQITYQVLPSPRPWAKLVTTGLLQLTWLELVFRWLEEELSLRPWESMEVEFSLCLLIHHVCPIRTTLSVAFATLTPSFG